jgi:hypothetical protein
MARRLRMFLLPAVLAGFLATTGAAPATVPPTECGMTKVNGKRFQIKTHSISCKRGKPWARSYLRSGRKPSGYRCRNYSPKVTKFRFICRRGARDFLAIRR